ncbi:MBG domain-containing protein [Myroides injenensis]|uniref:MBG domain-containing protein n=1 Tax=Myroides injenensis TaxID=1183151 RepID=UPI0022708BC2|nr:MBG domain-containing protein [Myroides injenensis]
MTCKLPLSLSKLITSLFLILSTFVYGQQEDIYPNSVNNIQFKNKIVDYNGEIQSITATNTPKGIIAKYSPKNLINAGVYEVTATFYRDNKIIDTKKAYLTINKINVGRSVQFKKKEVNYDGKKHTLELTGTLPEGAVATYSNNSYIDAGTYKPKVVITGINYKTSTRTSTLIIHKASIEGISLESNTFLYDGTYKSITINGTLPKGTTISYIGNNQKDIGTHQVTARINGGNNYNDLVLYGQIIITSQSIKIPNLENIVFKDKEVDFNKTIHSIEATNLPENVTVTYDKNEYINAGEYTITALFYFDDQLIGKKTAKLTINKIAFDRSIKFAKKVVIYTGSPQTIELVGDLPEDATIAYENNTHTDVGTYKAKVTLSGDNYKTSTRSNELIINPADIQNISFESKSFVYNGALQYIYITGSLPKGTSISYSNNGKAEIGTHQIIARIKGGNNYNSLTLYAQLIITAKPIVIPSLENVVFADKQVDYNGSIQSIEATNLPHNVSVIYDKSEYINTGVYTITALFYFNDQIIGKKTATLTINKIAFPKTIKFAKKIVTYDGTSHSIEITGELPEDTTVVYENNSHTDAGTYKAKATLSGANYKTSVRNNELIINKADIENISFESESFEYDGELKSIKITGELPPSVTVEYTNNNQKEIGTYQVTTFINGGINYNSLTLYAQLIITAKPIIIPSLENVVFADKQVDYNGEMQSIEATGLPDNVTVTYDKNKYISAGEYTITALFYFDDQLIGKKTATLTINKIAFPKTIKFVKKTVTYDGSSHSIKIIGELPEGTTVIYENNTHTNAGTYKAKATLSGENYKTSVRKNELIINKADIENISFESKSFEYDGEFQSIKITGELPPSVTVEYTNNNQKEIGTHQVTAFINGGRNYNSLTLYAQLIITAKPIIIPSLENVLFTDKQVDYNGEMQSIEATGLPNNVTVIYDQNEYINAGEYTITALFYFDDQLTGKKTATLTINKIAFPKTIKFAKKTVTYDGSYHSIEIIGELPTNTSVTYENNTHINAGIYKAKATLSGHNYKTSVRNNELIINKADIENISFESMSFEYDGEFKSIKITGELPPSVIVEYTNNNQKEIGTYQITAIIDGGRNYNSLTLYAQLIITAKPIVIPSLENVVFADKQVDFNGSIQSIKATNLPDNVSVIYDKNEYINAGEYTITALFYFDDQLIGRKTATLTINKIAFPKTIKFAKKTVTYDGTSHTLEITGELPEVTNVTYENNTHTDAGTYKAKATLSGENYKTSVRNNELIINKAEIENISFESKSFEDDGEDKSLFIKGILPPSVTVEYTNNNQKEIGTHQVTAFINGGINYNSLTLYAQLIITAKPIIIPSLENVVFADKQVDYNGAIQSIEATNLPHNVSVIYDKNEYINTGEYTITALFYFDDQLIGKKTATLTINKIAFNRNIKFAKKTVTYDGNSHSIEITGELPEDTTVVYENNTHTNAGTYKAKATLSGENYKTSIRNNELIINKADIENISFESESFEYDGEFKSIKITGELPPSVKVEYTNNNQKEIGTYQVTAIIDGGRNYNSLTLYAQLIITAKPIIIPSLENVLFTDKQVDYNGEMQSIEATGLPNNVTVIYDQNEYINAGEYTITALFYFDNQLIGKKTAILTINKIAFPKTIKFAKKTVTYDGTYHSIEITGELPEGTTVSYENNTHTDAGTYKAKAILSGDNYSTSTRNNELIINKADIENISFESKAFEYDGQSRSLFIKGNLPPSVTVEYINNNQKEIGTHQVTAFINGGRNYNSLTLYAQLIITAKPIIIPSLENVVFADKQVDFNGAFHYIKATNLPDNVTVTYDKNEYINAGEYTITALFYFDDQLIGKKTATLTINKIAFDRNIKFAKKTVTYDGTSHSIEITGDLPTNTSVVYENNTHTDAGTYKAKATLSGENYKTSIRNNELIINKADIENISFESKAFEYDGAHKSLFIKGNLPPSVTVEYTNNNQNEIGTYQITAIIDGSRNYNSLTLYAQLIITEKPIVIPSLENVVFADKQVDYNGIIQFIEATNLPDNVTVTYDKNKYISAGEYTITALFYFDDLLIGKKTAILTINKIAFPKTIKFAKKTVTYDGTSHSIEITGELPTNTSVAYENNTHIDAGTYKAKATLSGENYKTSVRNNELIINKADIENISFESKSFEYDGQNKSLYIKGNLPIGASVSYVGNNQNEIGSYQVTAIIDGGRNYNSLTLYAQLIITAKPIVIPSLENVAFVDKQVDYNGSIQTIEAINLPDNVTVTYDKNEYISAGEYTITALFYFNDQLIGKKTAKLTINKIAFPKTIKFAKKTVTYDGTSHSIEITGDLPTNTSVVYENNTHTDAGTYKAKATLSGDNYKTSIRNNELIINKADIENISFESKSFEYDGQNKSLYIKGNLPIGASVSYVGNNQSDIGTYQVTAIINGGQNYVQKNLVAILTITKPKDTNLPPLLDQIQFNDREVFYNGQVQTIEVTNLPHGIVVEYDNNNFINAGKYIVTAYFYSNSNLLGQKEAILTIKKADIKNIIFEDDTYEYDGKEKALKIIGDLPLNTTVNYVGNNQIDIGEYIIIAEINGGSNYNNKVLKALLTIKERTKNKNALINQLIINNIVYNNPSQEIVHLLNCNQNNSKVSIVLSDYSDKATLNVLPHFDIDINSSGEYKTVIMITSENGEITNHYLIKIIKPIDYNKVLIQNHDNSISVNKNFMINGAKIMKYYWYKNNEIINEDSNLFENNTSYTPYDFEDNNYYALLISQTGEELCTCPIYYKSVVTNSIRLYPNPIPSTSNQMFITIDKLESNFTYANVSIFSIDNKKIHSQELYLGENTVLLPSQISKGIYIAIINLNGKTETIKFIVN